MFETCPRNKHGRCAPLCLFVSYFFPSAVQYAGFTVMPVLGGFFSYVLGSTEIPLLGRFLMLTQFTAPAFFVMAMSVAVFVLLYLVFQDGESGRVGLRGFCVSALFCWFVGEDGSLHLSLLRFLMYP